MKKLFLLLVVVGCSSSSQEDEVIKKSMEAHESALKASKEVVDKIAELEVQILELEEEKRSVFQDSLTNLKSDYEYWESTIVEVPGSEDHDHHHHDHHGHEGHNHGESDPDLTPEMVLEIQEDLNARIGVLNQRVESLSDLIQK